MKGCPSSSSWLPVLVTKLQDQGKSTVGVVRMSHRTSIMRTLAGLTLHWLEVLHLLRLDLPGNLSHCPCKTSVSSADDIACHMADLLKLYLEMPEIASEAASAEMVSDMAEQMHEPMQEYFIPGTACSNDLQVAMSSRQMAVHTRIALLIRMITEAGHAITEENDT